MGYFQRLEAGESLDDLKYEIIEKMIAYSGVTIYPTEINKNNYSNFYQVITLKGAMSYFEHIEDPTDEIIFILMHFSDSLQSWQKCIVNAFSFKYKSIENGENKIKLRESIYGIRFKNNFAKMCWDTTRPLPYLSAEMKTDAKYESKYRRKIAARSLQSKHKTKKRSKSNHAVSTSTTMPAVISNSMSSEISMDSDHSALKLLLFIRMKMRCQLSQETLHDIAKKIDGWKGEITLPETFTIPSSFVDKIPADMQLIYWFLSVKYPNSTLSLPLVQHIDLQLATLLKGNRFLFNQEKVPQIQAAQQPSLDVSSQQNMMANRSNGLPYHSLGQSQSTSASHVGVARNTMTGLFNTRTPLPDTRSVNPNFGTVTDEEMDRWLVDQSVMPSVDSQRISTSAEISSGMASAGLFDVSSASISQSGWDEIDREIDQLTDERCNQNS